MTDIEINIPEKRKPRPGSLPLPSEVAFVPLHPAQTEVPPFIPPDELHPPAPKPKKQTRGNLEKLKVALSKADKLRIAVRNDAFDDWVRRCLVVANEPKEWTQSSVLYENYLARAKDYGRNRPDKRLLKTETATETRFGILMRDAGFTKKRRSKGWYYPLRLKQGA